MDTLIKLGLQVAGAAQLALCVASLAIPRCLQWSERTKQLIPLMRQMFYTYAVYILASHFFFAGVSLFLAEELMEGDVIGNALLAFMGLWWTGRLVCQFFFFDRTGIPETPFNKLAETVLVCMFFGLVSVYWGTLLWIWLY